jgi:hypothetical protein
VIEPSYDGFAKQYGKDTPTVELPPGGKTPSNPEKVNILKVNVSDKKLQSNPVDE